MFYNNKYVLEAIFFLYKQINWEAQLFKPTQTYRLNVLVTKQIISINRVLVGPKHLQNMGPVLVVAPQPPPPFPSKSVQKSKGTVRLLETSEGGGLPL